MRESSLESRAIDPDRPKMRQKRSRRSQGISCRPKESVDSARDGIGQSRVHRKSKSVGASARRPNSTKSRPPASFQLGIAARKTGARDTPRNSRRSPVGREGAVISAIHLIVRIARRARGGYHVKKQIRKIQVPTRAIQSAYPRNSLNRRVCARARAWRLGGGLSASGGNKTSPRPTPTTTTPPTP